MRPTAKFTRTDVPDELWERVRPCLPAWPERPTGGRPPVADRVVLAGIVYRLRTGCPWKAIPDEFGSGSTCHRRFGEWTEYGVFRKLWEHLLTEYHSERGAGLDWCSLDSASVKAPKGGPKRVRIPPTEGKAAQNATF